jgi:hypothetical protein
MNILKSIESSVGKLWLTLNSEGSLSENKILKEINVKNNLFYGAVGWLARENKIRFDEKNNYVLGETNLKDQIGRNAGKVWQVLETWGEVEVSSISKLARITEKDVFFAIGWLAKEGKIEGEVVDYKDKKIKFRLK